MNFTAEIYLKTNELTDEKVCIGLFAISPERKFFSYSMKKLKLASGLMEYNALKNIESTLKRFRNGIGTNPEMPLSELDDYLNFERFQYLTTYSKGLLYFKKPKPLDFELNNESFDKLFRLFVGEFDEVKSKVVTARTLFNKELKSEEFNKIDVNYTLNPETIPTIYAPHKIDFVGKNGVLHAGNFIDFATKPETIDKSLMEFDRIATGLNLFSVSKGIGAGHYKAYFSEPEDIGAKKVLDRARRDTTKSYELVGLDKINEIKLLLNTGEFMKFSEIV